MKSSTFLKIYIGNALLFTLLPVLAVAELTIGEELEMGDNLSTLRQKLESSCAVTQVVNVTPPSFPLSESSEQHLLCENYANNDVGFEKAVFTLADDRFVRMEAWGVDADQLRTKLGRELTSYLDFDVYQFAAFWLSEPNNSLVWINNEARHPNLFAWRNPYLHDAALVSYPGAVIPPKIVDFDRSLSEQRSLIESACTPALVQTEEEIWLRNKPGEQIQVNCFNYPYAGFERKLELVYGDGRLEVVWVLTGKQEEGRMRDALVAQWGQPIISNHIWEVFDEGRVSLRKDKPELLLLSDAMIPLYLDDFENPD